MAFVRPGTVGILPAGALGVAFYYHLTEHLKWVDGRVFFVERDGSASGPELRKSAMLHIAHDTTVQDVSHAELFAPNLQGCAEHERLPELLLVCTQPDQILGVITSWVHLLEWVHARGVPEIFLEVPSLILCSNGIYFQRVRQFLLEKLEEATLLGRLPDLWPETMPRLVGRLLRGVTIQTGQREGSGPDALYRPGSRGRTRLAGGDVLQRQRCAELLGELGAWVELTENATPTRVEFDKALVNLLVNLLGQIAAIDDAGIFHALTVEEIMNTVGEAEIRELVERVVAVGRAVQAYGPAEDINQIAEEMLASAEQHREHIPSSLQWIETQLRRGTLRPKLTPTESWLLDPLIRYAHVAGLEETAYYFDRLTRRAEQRLALAIAAHHPR